MPGDEDIVSLRLGSQLLGGRRAQSADEVVGRLLAIQAQDARGFRLAVRSRSSGLTASDVDQALTERRSLVVTWLNRGTLHLVAAEDYWLLHPLTAPRQSTANERRLRQEGVSAKQTEAGVARVVEAVTSEGPQTTAQLRRRLDAASIPTAGQALVHILLATSLRGHVVRGPMIGIDHAYVSVKDWLGAPPPALDRSEALAELGRRYLAGHAPAAADDLAKWAGITIGDARRAFAIAEELEPMRGGLVTLVERGQPASWPPPRLLGQFDPLLHGWASRAPFVGRHAGVVTRNGTFRPVALVEGRVVATWGVPGGVVTIDPLEHLTVDVVDALVEDAADVLRFLELPARPAVVR